MDNFCTYFDSHYLSRGLALYESLSKHCTEFHLYVFAFDEECLQILKKLNLPNVTLIPLREFEDETLLAIKQNRSFVEYCWTCTPSVILYTLDTYNLDTCTYLDADLYFFSSPSPLLDELDHNSIIITEHRYTPRYDQTRLSGKYCVQFMTFRNDDRGRQALVWWQNACNSWCYARYENGKFGDQKYLDDWPIRFKGVHVLEHVGGGIAPWNVQQYVISKYNNSIMAKTKNSNFKFDVVFYHFHHLSFFSGGKISLGRYQLKPEVREMIYYPYIAHLKLIASKYLKSYESVNYHCTTELSLKNVRSLLRFMKHKMLLNVIRY